MYQFHYLRGLGAFRRPDGPPEPPRPPKIRFVMIFGRFGVHFSQFFHPLSVAFWLPLASIFASFFHRSPHPPLSPPIRSTHRRIDPSTQARWRECRRQLDNQFFLFCGEPGQRFFYNPATWETLTVPTLGHRPSSSQFLRRVCTMFTPCFLHPTISIFFTTTDGLYRVHTIFSRRPSMFAPCFSRKGDERRRKIVEKW